MIFFTDNGPACHHYDPSHVESCNGTVYAYELTPDNVNACFPRRMLARCLACGRTDSFRAPNALPNSDPAVFLRRWHEQQVGSGRSANREVL